MRAAGIGDYVVVHQSFITDLRFKGKWADGMNAAIGRVGYCWKGNPEEGYSIKFTTTKMEALDQFRFPTGSFRLAMPDDNRSDSFIKIAKEGVINDDI